MSDDYCQCIHTHIIQIFLLTTLEKAMLEPHVNYRLMDHLTICRGRQLAHLYRKPLSAEMHLPGNLCVTLGIPMKPRKQFLQVDLLISGHWRVKNMNRNINSANPVLSITCLSLLQFDCLQNSPDTLTNTRDKTRQETRQDWINLVMLTLSYKLMIFHCLAWC